MSTTAVVVDRLQKIFSGEPPPQLPDWNPNWQLKDFRLEQEHFHRRLLEYIRRLFGKITEANFSLGGGDGLVDWRYHAATHKFQVKRQVDGVAGDWEDAVPDQPVTESHVTNLRYDSTTHALQLKSQSAYVLEASAESDWSGWFSPTTSTDLVEWHYDATTHKFQYKTRQEYVFEKGSDSAYTNAPADQPVARTNLVEWHYDATAHKFKYKTQAGYTLEVNSISAYTDAPADQPVVISRVDRQVTYDTGTETFYEDYTQNVYVLEKGADTDDSVITTAEECDTTGSTTDGGSP